MLRRCLRCAASVASRSGLLRGEGTIEVFAQAQQLERQGKDIIHVEIGDPDFTPPPHAIQAAIKSMTDGNTHYSAAGGIVELKQEIAKEVFNTRQVTITPDDVFVSPGSKPIIFHTLMALCEKGDEVVFPAPGFPAYETTIEYTGATPVRLRLVEEDGFRFSHTDLRAVVNDKTKLIILNSPSNPTGGVLTVEDIQLIAELAEKHDCYVLADEIYSKMIFDGATHHSIFSLPGMAKRTILLDGFSKSYAMTGCRVGWGVFPPELMDPVRNLAINNWTCVPVFLQHAALACLTGPSDSVDEMRDAYDKRRKAVVGALNKMPGVKCQMPGGAFYCLPNIQGTGLTSAECASYLLHECGVCALPGTVFGEYGEGFLRVAFCNSLENLVEGMKRMDAGLKARVS
eukprot:TRINITY_DN84561_c0_g1_i1.p1 TRINITY_DN84561_c0_g1~~TRINITY_DN84561_c0_g1_i1.p1  ORF type:complete len:400 (+),score=26.20 TRINITY_DN84561_c0_g1_i1:30-1229(+)